MHKIDEIVQCYGYIVDYKIFADDYRILQIEVESQKVELFFQSLLDSFSVEKYNSIHLNKAEDDEVFVNVKFFWAIQFFSYICIVKIDYYYEKTFYNNSIVRDGVDGCGAGI